MSTRPWQMGLIMVLVVSVQGAGLPGPVHWQNLQQGLEILEVSDAQRVVIQREYLKLEESVEALVSAAKEHEIGLYAVNRREALGLLGAWRATILPFLTDSQLEIADGVVVGVDPWRADLTLFSFLASDGIKPFTPERLVLELPIEAAAQRTLLRQLSTTAWTRHTNMVNALTDYEEFRRRLVRARRAGANLVEWIDEIGWEGNAPFWNATRANRKAVEVETTTRDRARVMLWALAVAQHAWYEAAPAMLAVAHLLKDNESGSERVWDHFDELHEAVVELITASGKYGDRPLIASPPNETRDGLMRMSEAALKVQDVVRSKMWTATEQKFDPQSMVKTGYVVMRSVQAEVPARIERDSLTEIDVLNTAESIGLNGRSVDAMRSELQQAMRFAGRDIFGWASFDFVELVLCEKGLKSPNEDEWDAVIAVRTERIRRLLSANHQRHFDSAELLDLADQECAVILRALIPTERQLEVERHLWRRANPLVANQIDMRREVAIVKGKQLVREITPLLLEWERAGRRTIGFSHIPGIIDLNLLEIDELRVSQAERAVRAVMIEW